MIPILPSNYVSFIFLYLLHSPFSLRSDNKPGAPVDAMSASLLYENPEANLVPRFKYSDVAERAAADEYKQAGQ